MSQYLVATEPAGTARRYRASEIPVDAGSPASAMAAAADKIEHGIHNIIVVDLVRGYIFRYAAVQISNLPCECCGQAKATATMRGETL
jgi:hypothetical protein